MSQLSDPRRPFGNRRPFDPLPLLVEFLHDEVCPGHPTPLPAPSCLLARAAAQDLHERLAAVGLAVMPADVVRFIERRYDELLAPASAPEQVPANPSAARALAPTWVVTQHDGGTTRREGPFAHWLAEMLIGDLNHNHPPDMRSACLEPEAAWIERLMSDLGPDALGLSTQ